MNLRAIPSTIRPLQPSRSKSNEASQTSQSSQRITDVAYYTEYYYLIESLATIKSVILACDVPGGDELVTGFFEGFAEVVR
jgi:sister-chromatid-cohesion protein PDS5